MKKWLIILGCSLALCGCTESNIVAKGGEVAPDFETKQNVELQWQQAFDDMGSEYVDSGEVLDLAFFQGDEADGSESIYITAIVRPDMKPGEAVELAALMIKSLNDFLADQDFNIKVSSNDSYGSYYDTHNVGVRIIPEDQQESQEQALVDDLIMAGEAYRPVKANR